MLPIVVKTLHINNFVGRAARAGHHAAHNFVCRFSHAAEHALDLFAHRFFRLACVQTCC